MEHNSFTLVVLRSPKKHSQVVYQRFPFFTDYYQIYRLVYTPLKTLIGTNL